MNQISGDEGSAEWKSSRPATRGAVKAAWLADTVARVDAKRKTADRERNAQNKVQVKAKPDSRGQKAVKKAASVKKKSRPLERAEAKASAGGIDATFNKSAGRKSKVKEAGESTPTLQALAGAVERAMPSAIQPMLATIVEKSFDNPDWLFEIKWDGYRAIAFVGGGRTRLVSRNQNDMTAQFPELASMAKYVNADRAILDGEIVALDDKGRPSFSLMQQRTGFQPGKRRIAGKVTEGVQDHLLRL